MDDKNSKKINQETYKNMDIKTFRMEELFKDTFYEYSIIKYDKVQDIPKLLKKFSEEVSVIKPVMVLGVEHKVELIYTLKYIDYDIIHEEKTIVFQVAKQLTKKNDEHLRRWMNEED